MIIMSDAVLEAVRKAFYALLKTRGIFGIKPSDYWIHAIWQKDFMPLVVDEMQELKPPKNKRSKK